MWLACCLCGCCVRRVKTKQIITHKLIKTSPCVKWIIMKCCVPVSWEDVVPGQLGALASVTSWGFVLEHNIGSVHSVGPQQPNSHSKSGGHSTASNSRVAKINWINKPNYNNPQIQKQTKYKNTPNKNNKKIQKHKKYKTTKITKYTLTNIQNTIPKK